MGRREYQIRASRQRMRSFLAQDWRGIASPAARGFYRPAQRPDPRSLRPKRAGPEQLVLQFEAPQPLADVFPEAYE
jgi:hypothetical protein